MSAFSCGLLLFDLDGTLVDSAPDLHRAANVLLASRGRPPVDYRAFRPRVSQGGLAMLRQAFAEADDPALTALLPEFLAIYADGIAVASRPFDGIAALLAAVEAAGARWGVVTNKPEALARALLEALGLLGRCAVLIGGDTLAFRKPHPEPLLAACRQVGVTPRRSVYVGDDPRDIEAARAAVMRSIAAAWGYVEASPAVGSWGADAVAATVDELHALLQLVPVDA